MPDFVAVAVVFALFLTILLGRDNNVYSGRKRESNDFRCVIATIGQKILGVYSLELCPKKWTFGHTKTDTYRFKEQFHRFETVMPETRYVDDVSH